MSRHESVWLTDTSYPLWRRDASVVTKSDNLVHLPAPHPRIRGMAEVDVHPRFRGMTENETRAALRSEVQRLPPEALAALTWTIGDYPDESDSFASPS